MMNTEEQIYDDEAAVKYILNALPAEAKGKITEDDVNYVLDVVYEFYDKNGFLDEESDDEVTVDEEEIMDFVLKCAKEDDMKNLTKEIVIHILDGEFDYCKSIGVFTDEE